MVSNENIVDPSGAAMAMSTMPRIGVQSGEDTPRATETAEEWIGGKAVGLTEEPDVI